MTVFWIIGVNVFSRINRTCLSCFFCVSCRGCVWASRCVSADGSACPVCPGGRGSSVSCRGGDGPGPWRALPLELENHSLKAHGGPVVSPSVGFVFFQGNLFILPYFMNTLWFLEQF